jgi:hypothetical protein
LKALHRTLYIIINGSQSMMLSSILARRTPAAAAVIKASSTPVLSSLNTELLLFENGFSGIQIRSLVTKKRKHRQEKRKRKEELAAKGISPPKPHNYISKDSPVLNAVSREERDAESKRSDEIAANELKAKMDIVKAPPMRFGFSEEGLVMSDRVKKLFDLQNGNQNEVIKAQKQRGMELFQTREGDTGSSAVQGEFDVALVLLFVIDPYTLIVFFFDFPSNCLNNAYSTDSDSFETTQER